jgi:hypothetical protein
MEDKIFDIVTDLIRDDISKDEAIDKLLILYNVSGSALLSKAKQMQLEQQHKIDSYTEYYTESEIGILNGVKRIVSLIERHYR